MRLYTLADSSQGLFPVPVVLRLEGFVFYFYSFDCQEPAHIHVDRDGKTATFWLRDGEGVLARPTRFSRRDVNRLRSILVDRYAMVLDAWHNHCD
jgi:hypothetical protein